ncbi:MAG: sensor histidine kinase [Desulfovibrionales bacterium]|nr:MAG: sensor histidine kinase [Desulfovibrionales bacterium]
MLTEDIYSTYDWLRKHIFMYLGGAGLLSLTLVGFVVHFEYRSVVNEKATERLVSIVLKHKGEINDFLADIATTMRTITMLEPLERLRDQETLEELFHRLQASTDNAYEDLGVIDAQGNHLAYVGPFDLMDKNYSEEKWFANVMRDEIYISNVFLGFRNLPHFIIAVHHGEGDQSWILRATVNADRFGELVEHVRFGETGHAFLVSSDGLYQTNPRVGGRILDRVPEREFDFKVFEGVRYQHMINHEGKRVFRAMTWMKDNDWLLVVEQEAGEVLGEFHTERRKAAAFFLGGGLFITLLTLFTIRALSRRVIQVDAERHLVDEQLLQSQKLASIGELSAGIAHEINNPLAVIGEEAGWMQDLLKREHFQDVEELAELQDSLREIVKQAGRCRDITHKLLRFARKSDAVVRAVGLNKLVEEVIEMREHQAELNNIQIVRKFEPEIPVVHTDPAQIRQVLLNLINNAMDALGQSGQITVSTDMWDKGGAIIRVADNGPGIAKENLGKIFDPFFTTKPPGKGTGLGLSICHGILEKLGAKISVASKVGEGTVFTVRIPLEPKTQKSDV